MATVAEWIEGARPRTLPNALAPVIAGSGVAAQLDAFSWWRMLLALLVALSLIIGVNFANDYSDGVRGTDADRVGPLRLVGSGAAQPIQVLTAAVSCLGVAAVSGLVLVVATGHWRLLLLGGMCLAAAWFYTGGRKPYGYSGFGEVAVFVFFGLAAVLGTVYVQAGSVTWEAVACAVAIGGLSSGVLVANNLRDIPTDAESGKRTLAVLLGDRRTRLLYVALVVVTALLTVALGLAHPLAFIALAALLLLVKPVHTMVSGRTGLELVPVLRDTGLAMLAWSLLTAAALTLA